MLGVGRLGGEGQLGGVEEERVRDERRGPFAARCALAVGGLEWPFPGGDADGVARGGAEATAGYFGGGWHGWGLFFGLVVERWL